MTRIPYWDGRLIELNETDSTNNYAMRCISEGMSGHGWAVRANYQLAGKGQMGNQWQAEAGANILCSLVLNMEGQDLQRQFILNACFCAALAEALRELTGLDGIYVKWPNDLLVDGKKIGGILIENQLRGTVWTHAILGFGVNVNQTHFHALTQATSLKRIQGYAYDIAELNRQLLNKIKLRLEAFLAGDNSGLERYNKWLKHRGEKMDFQWHEHAFEGILRGVGADGCIQLDIDDQPHFFKHKEITWSDSAWAIQ